MKRPLTAAARSVYSATVAGKQPVTGLGGPRITAAKAVSICKHDGFFASGVSSMGDRAGGAFGLAGRRIRSANSRFGRPPRLAAVVGGSKPHTELHTMTATHQGALTPTLSFHDTPLTLIDRDGQQWLASADVAKALGYAADDAVSRIYRRNADEFTPGMSQTVKLTVSGNYQKETRLFTLRGAHLVAIFSRTKVAKEFRRWVLDILDKEAAPAALPAPSVDPKALLLAGMSDPVPLPDEVELALRRRTWELTHEAHDLIEAHLRRRVAYTANIGHPKRYIDTGLALDAINEGDLGHALTYKQAERIDFLRRDAVLFSRRANQLVEDLAAASKGQLQ